MTDLEKILWTSAATICGGVIVYVIGQLLSKFLIEPMQDLKKAIGDTRFNLAFHAPTIRTPISRTPARCDEAYAAIMKSSCDLLTKLEAVPFYRYIPRSFLPSAGAISQAAVDLRALSTYLYETGDNAAGHIDQVNGRVANIEKMLRIAPLQ
jgi:hypothetical protein